MASLRQEYESEKIRVAADQRTDAIAKANVAIRTVESLVDRVNELEAENVQIRLQLERLDEIQIALEKMRVWAGTVKKTIEKNTGQAETESL